MIEARSDDLKQTVILPTLDSPMPTGRSAMWCTSFQFAWTRLKNDVAKEPVRLQNAGELADRLNRGNQSEDDVDPSSVFAAAGLAKDGIADHIRAEMARRFPKVRVTELDAPPDGAVAYAYLAASAKFDIPFFENDEPLAFTDSSGASIMVGSFGIRQKAEYAFPPLRGQVKVLYLPKDAYHHTNEYILDL